MGLRTCWSWKGKPGSKDIAGMFGIGRAEILHSWGHSTQRTHCWMHTLRGNRKNKAKLLSGSQLPFWRTSAPFPQASRGSMKFQQEACMWTRPNPRPCIYLVKHWGSFLYPIFILLYLRLKRIPTPPLPMPCDHTLRLRNGSSHILTH